MLFPGSELICIITVSPVLVSYVMGPHGHTVRLPTYIWNSRLVAINHALDLLPDPVFLTAISYLGK